MGSKPTSQADLYHPDSSESRHPEGSRVGRNASYAEKKDVCLVIILSKNGMIPKSDSLIAFLNTRIVRDTISIFSNTSLTVRAIKMKIM